MRKTLAILLCASATLAVAEPNPAPVQRLAIKGLSIGMPYQEAQRLIYASLDGALNQRTCTNKKIHPTDDTYGIGDTLISCEGSYTIFGSAIASFSAIFNQDRLAFVGIGTFEDHSAEGDTVPAIMRALAIKHGAIPESKLTARYTRFPIYNIEATMRDSEGNTLVSNGIMEVTPGGTTHQRVVVQLHPPQFEEQRRQRLASVDRQTSLTHAKITNARQKDI